MTSRRPPRLRIAGIALVAIAASIALAACGDDDSDTTAAAGSTTGTAAAADTISVQSVGGRDALVDADGNALYFNDRDTASKIACTDECAAIWVPVTAAGQPSSDDSSVEAKLGVVAGPGGDSQVTFDGKPLYTFTEDSPGQVTGDGFTDSFGGVTFTWTAATAGGSAKAATTTTTTGTSTSETETEATETEDSGGGSGSDDSSGSGSGGYGY